MSSGRVREHCALRHGPASRVGREEVRPWPRYELRARDVVSRVGGMNSRTYVRSQHAPVSRSSRQVCPLKTFAPPNKLKGESPGSPWKKKKKK
ncbi:hypothetical protein, partial [Streptomyces europaeiscabiei]|uniref:hypothetical protein n=1 Tax=Streptomyces europaeiscabiei TaxID=146819 RepID=UPI0029B31AA8